MTDLSARKGDIWVGYDGTVLEWQRDMRKGDAFTIWGFKQNGGFPDVGAAIREHMFEMVGDRVMTGRPSGTVNVIRDGKVIQYSKAGI